MDKSKKHNDCSSECECIPLTEMTTQKSMLTSDNIVTSRAVKGNRDATEFVENELYEINDKMYSALDPTSEDEAYAIADHLTVLGQAKVVKQRRTPPPIPCVLSDMPPPVPIIPMTLSIHGDDSSDNSDFETMPEEMQGTVHSMHHIPVQTEHYVSPLCHDHGIEARNPTSFHEYDPVYIPHHDPQAMVKLIDSANYVCGRNRLDSRITNPYEEIQFEDIYSTVDESNSNDNQSDCIMYNSEAESVATLIYVMNEIDVTASLGGALTTSNHWQSDPKYSDLIKSDREGTLSEQHQYTMLSTKTINSQKQGASEQQDCDNVRINIVADVNESTVSVNKCDDNSQVNLEASNQSDKQHGMALRNKCESGSDSRLDNRKSEESSSSKYGIYESYDFSKKM